ncbi:MAG TPA: hypothetical protein VL172_09030, partial [Kofleriaceae bacterium]|nr:hypothetical protein [Kofleriaceae bacterium]
GGGGGGGGIGGLGGGAILGETHVDVPVGPTFPDDTLGATEALTLAAGAAHLSYDSVRDQATLDGNAAARWQRIIERTRMGYRLEIDADAAGGAIRYQGGGDPEPSTARLFVLSTTALAEGHFYAGPQFYGLTEAALGLSVNNAKTNPPGGGNTDSRTYLNADVHAAIGGGFGRMLDLGEALRLRRIERVLQHQRLLGRPITGDLAAKVMRAWWALRGELGLHRRLLVTIALLREAGALLGEPDASTTYQLLEVLRDGALDHRPSGLDVQVAVAESYLMRDDDLGADEGRAESVLVRARYGRQLASTVQELVGEASGRLRILAPDGEAAPWEVRATAAWRRYVYGDHFDPIGAFEVTAELGASDADVDGTPFAGVAERIGGGVGWMWIPSRASRFRLAANAALESGELFVGASFEATYGLLDAAFVGGSAYDAMGSPNSPAK